MPNLILHRCMQTDIALSIECWRQDFVNSLRKETAMKSGIDKNAKDERMETQSHTEGRVSFLFVFNIVMWTIAVFAGLLTLVIRLAGG